MHQMKSHPLKIERELRGWSQTKLAEKLGTTSRSVNRWEQGLALPYPHYCKQLCNLFGKTAKELGLLPAADENEAQVTPPVQPQFLVDPAIPEAWGNTNGLLGRSGLLLQIKQRLLESGSLALTALNGLPGIGKTTLAIALVRDQQVQAYFRDGILWTGLGPQPNVLGLLARWGVLLGIKPAGVENVNSWEAWRRALQASIGNRRLLLVIDDAWSVEDALAFQVGGPQSTHLLTTRLPRVAFAFAQQEAMVVPELEDVDGLELLARYVPQLVQQDPEDARTLVRAVGGLPLALTLIGKYLAAQASTGQPRRLQTALARLHDTEQRLRVSIPTAPSERSPSLPGNIPLSLHATITVSARQLSPQVQAALRALAIFPAKPNSFSEMAALAVSQEPAETLDTLWNAGLLESSGPKRYTLHQTIADYAQTQVQDPTARRRLVNYMLTYIQTHKQDYEALELETSNILASLDTARDLGMSQALLQGATAFMAFLRVRGHYSQADQYLQLALQAATTLEDPIGQMTILRHLSIFSALRGDYSQAEHYSRLGLVLARQLERIDEVSAFLTTLGLVAFYHGDNAQAQVCLEEGLQLARQVGGSEQICTLLSNLSRVARAQGNYTQAEVLCQQGLALAQQNKHWDLMSLLLAFLGAIAREQGNYDQSEQYCLQGLSLARQQGHREHLSHLLRQLGSTAYYRGQYKQAEACFQEGLTLVRQIGHRAQICDLLANLGAVLTLQEDYTQAVRYLEEGVELARQLENRESLSLLLMNLGGAIGRQGNYSRANAYVQESVEVARQIGTPWHINGALVEWGELHLRYQQLDAAAAAFSEVPTSMSDSEQDPQWIARSQYGLAQIAALRGDITEARRLGTNSVTILETIGHHKAGEVRHWLDSLTGKEAP